MRLKHLQLHLVLADHFNLDKNECRSLVKAIDKRNKKLNGIPFVIGVIVLWTWVYLWAISTNVLKDTNFNIIGFLGDKGVIGIILAFLIGFGGATFWGLIVVLAIRHRLLQKQFQYHLFTPACFWCGYSLKGLESESNYIKCPECGERSRIGR